MKKLYLFLFSILISFNSYSLLDKIVCVETDAEIRNGLYYLTNMTKPFTGNSLCKSEDGRLKKGKIKDGKKYKIWAAFYENGQIQQEHNYIEGKLNGKSTVWFENGHIEVEKNYKDGQLNGKSTWWLDNGQKFFEGNYRDGKKDGKWVFWKKNRKEEERNYKDDYLVDKTIFKYSYFTGQLKCEKKYKDGKCISGC